MDSLDVKAEIAKYKDEFQALFNGYTAEFLHSITGSTPESVTSKAAQHITQLEPVSVGNFIDACVLAAAAERKPVEDYLQKPFCKNARDFVMEHLSIDGRMNFTALNLLGHCILAGGVENEGSSVIPKVRGKLCADDIWKADLGKSMFSAKQKEIIGKKVLRFNYKEAVKYGSSFLEAAYANRDAKMKRKAKTEATTTATEQVAKKKVKTEATTTAKEQVAKKKIKTEATTDEVVKLKTEGVAGMN